MFTAILRKCEMTFCANFFLSKRSFFSILYITGFFLVEFLRFVVGMRPFIDLAKFYGVSQLKRYWETDTAAALKQRQLGKPSCVVVIGCVSVKIFVLNNKNRLNGSQIEIIGLKLQDKASFKPFDFNLYKVLNEFLLWTESLDSNPFIKIIKPSCLY